jgi:solute carrier family 6 amino acid transporter-like protein 5/7/9/14
MIKSFYPTLPWSFCWDKWNDGTVNCIPADGKINGTNNNSSLPSESSSELFFIREVIKQKNQIDDGLGSPDWQLTLWLLAAWFVVFLVIIKGVKSSGKVSYFLALFPYCVLITLLIRAVTLEGAWNGIKFFITPDFSKLLKPQVSFIFILFL